MKIILVFVLTCLLGCKPGQSQIFSKPKIEGAFGQKLGVVFDTKLSKESSTNLLGIVCAFDPPTPHPFFHMYAVTITPITHKVFQITAMGEKQNESDNQTRMEAVVKMLQDKYGLQLDPLESRADSKTLTSSDKNYTVSVGYDNQSYWAPLVLKYLYAPGLHLSIAEYDQLSKKAVNEAAKNTKGL